MASSKNIKSTNSFISNLSAERKYYPEKLEGTRMKSPLSKSGKASNAKTEMQETLINDLTQEKQRTRTEMTEEGKKPV